MLRFLAKGFVIVAMLATPFAVSSETASAQQMDDCVNYSPCVPDRGNNGLNCDDISFSVRVIGNDHNGFDHDNDGIGCESNGPAPSASSGSQQGFTLTPAQQASLAAPPTAAAPAQASAGQGAAVAADDSAAAPAPFTLTAAQAASLASPLDSAAAEAPSAAPAAQAASPASAAPPAAPSSICDPNYVPCIPNTTGDALNCSQIAGVVTVVGDDHNNFDTDGDGVGCEGPDEPSTSAAPAAAAPVNGAATVEPDTPVLAVTGPESSRALAGLWLVGSGLTMLGLASSVRRRRS